MFLTLDQMLGPLASKLVNDLVSQFRVSSCRGELYKVDMASQLYV